MSDKPKVGFFEFTSCEGCQLTVVDTLQDHPEILDAVDIVEFREASSDKHDGQFDIAFVEGSVTRPSDEAKVRKIRERSKLVVALGACAHLGGINAIRNNMGQQTVANIVYGDKADWFESYTPRPIGAVVDVDAYIPGCPIDRNEFATALTHLLQGRMPKLADYPLCVECKLRGNICMYQRGQTCLGPITRAGCDAVCPAYGYGCEGCRGIAPGPNVNIDSMKAVLRENGMKDEQIDSKMSMFLNYQKIELEAEEVSE
jgi:sulfhydrogenase subunit delta